MQVQPIDDWTKWVGYAIGLIAAITYPFVSLVVARSGRSPTQKHVDLIALAEKRLAFWKSYLEFSEIVNSTEHHRSFKADALLALTRVEKDLELEFRLRWYDDNLKGKALWQDFPKPFHQPRMAWFSDAASKTYTLIFVASLFWIFYQMSRLQTVAQILFALLLIFVDIVVFWFFIWSFRVSAKQAQRKRPSEVIVERP